MDDELVGSPKTVVRRLLTADTDDLVVVTERPEFVAASIVVAADLGERAPAMIRLLATDDAARAATEEFLVATRAVDLRRSGRLSFRRADAASLPTLVISPSMAVSVVDADEDVAGVRTTDADVVDSVRNTYRGALSRAPPFELSTPPYSRVLETLGDRVGEGVRADVDETLPSIGAVRAADADVDEVDVLLLIAAKHGRQLHDLYQWGGDVGIASRATFSNRKRRLESAGLLDTERVKQGVGRPRQRLRLAESLRDADVPDVIRAARSVLA